MTNMDKNIFENCSSNIKNCLVKDAETIQIMVLYDKPLTPISAS